MLAGTALQFLASVGTDETFQNRPQSRTESEDAPSKEVTLVKDSLTSLDYYQIN
jgi:hypothetical protein